jgi:hypothetical protein
MGLLSPSGKSLRRKSRRDTGRRHRTARGNLLRHLRFEPLEDRCLLAALWVTSADDSSDALTTPGTLRYEIQQANSDGIYLQADTINFNTTEMGGSVITLQQGSLDLAGEARLTIAGPGITINGGGSNIFQVATGGRLTLNGLTLAGGTAATANGGAISNAGTLTLQDCTFTDNTATGSVDGGSGLGGAVYNAGTLVTSSDTFSGNSASGGAAIANGPAGVATLDGDTYSGSSATEQGGAIYNDEGAMTVYGCTLSGNTAAVGGGLFNSGTVTLNTATLSGNTATGEDEVPGLGGALFNMGTMTLSASTVSANFAYQGGGIYNLDSLALVDTIVAANTLTSSDGAEPDLYGNVARTSTNNLIGDGTGMLGISNGTGGNQVGTGGTPINPLLAPLGTYNGGSTETMPPLPGSPALAAGGPVTTLSDPILAADTTIPVADAAVFESTDGLALSFEIDGELMSLQGVDLTDSTLTLSPRSSSPGYTAPAGHSEGAGLYFVYNALGPPPSLPPAIGAVQPVATDHLAFTAEPSNTAAGATITPAVQVSVEDASGSVVTTDSSSVTVAIGTNAGSGTLSGTLTEPAVDGVATFSDLSINNAGTGYTLAATDGSLAGATSGTFNITAPTPTNTSVSTSLSPSVFGQTVTFTATVTPTAGTFDNGGSVQFAVNGVNLGNPLTPSGGVATITDSALAASSSPYTVAATYSGDTQFGGSRGTLGGGQTVAQASTATSAVTSSQNPSTAGQSVTFSVTVSVDAPGAGTPSGTVTFYNGGVEIGTGPLSGGSASYTTSALAAGSDAITASYGGDTNFAGGNCAAGVNQTVNAVVRTATSVQLTSSESTVIVGQSLILTATVSPAAAEMAGESVDFVDTYADGTVTDLGPGILSASGVATLTSDLGFGRQFLTASYAGDASYAGSTSPPLTVDGTPHSLRDKTPTTTQLSVFPTHAILGGYVSLTAYISPWDVNMQTDPVDFKDTTTGTDLGPAQIQDYSAVFDNTTWAFASIAVPASLLGVGTTHEITASYEGDTWYLASTSAPVNEAVGQSAGLVVTVAGDPLPAGTTPGTLRYVLNTANQDAAGSPGQSDTIVFDTAAMGTTSIELGALFGVGATPLELKPVGGAATVTIDGGGQVYIDGAESGSGTFIVDPGAQAILTGLRIGNGNATSGGGIDNSGNLTVSNSTVFDNSAQSGGGIYNSALLTLTDDTFYNNYAEQGPAGGGGVYNAAGATMGATDCTFAQNHAGNQGAGIYNAAGATVNAIACTISGNSATNQGGGICNASGGTLTLTDTIVAGNTVTASAGATGPGISGSVAATSSYNFVGNCLGETGLSTAANCHNLLGVIRKPNSSQYTAVINPELASFGSYGGNMQTMPLLPGSRALGAGGGLPANVTADENGQPLTTPQPDIGACQTVSVAQFVINAPETTVPIGVPFDVTITAEDSSGNAIAYDGSVTLTASDHQPIVNNTNGVYMLSGVSPTVSVTLDTLDAKPMTLSADAGNAKKGTSGPITLGPGLPAKLKFIQEPCNVDVGQPMRTVIVEVLDYWGHLVTGDNTDWVTIAIATGPAGGTVSGNPIQAVGGEATFSELSLNVPGKYSLVATSGNLQQAAAVTAITVSPLMLKFLTQPSKVAAGKPISPAFTVEVVDQWGNLANWDDTDLVTIGTAINSSGGAVYGTIAVTVNGGQAIFSNLKIDKGGTYTLMATSPGLKQAPSYSFAVTATVDWTVLAYLDGDNDLEWGAAHNVEELETVGSTSQVDIVAQLDRGTNSSLTWDGCRCGQIEPNTDDIKNANGLVQPMASLDSAASMGQVNMGDPTQLTKFIEWGVQNYPANHYLLILYDHGSGLYGLCYDQTANCSISIDGLGSALANTGTRMDVLALDACLMDQEDIIPQVEPNCNVFVGSEVLEPCPGFSGLGWLADLAAGPSMTAAHLGADIVEKYGAQYGPSSSTALAAIDMSKQPALIASLDAFGQAAVAAADWGVISTAEADSNPAQIGDDVDLGTFLQDVALFAGPSSQVYNASLLNAANAADKAYNASIIPKNYGGSNSEGCTGINIMVPKNGTILGTLASGAGYTAQDLTFLADAPHWLAFVEAFSNYINSCPAPPLGGPEHGVSGGGAGKAIPAGAAALTAVVSPSPQTLLAGPAGGSLLASLTTAPATTFAPPQWEPAPAAAATLLLDRLKAVDAALAAGNAAGQDHATAPAGGNLSSDNVDAFFLPLEPASWGVKLAD